eukprot:CAMPEP_0119418548 /NCGR_PEP_ID=MMETSP1335-20130426/18522_1 /TAXON_ID=259385 /ORGANISM="Chrysoculter rhomboideus, Strain RCC1486" /LENGTH=53 /DNA_ID=CAMNT_0007443801 /DNA_START=166 /DNA_END=323 /DNA_ORIENTATION=+
MTRAAGARVVLTVGAAFQVAWCPAHSVAALAACWRGVRPIITAIDGEFESELR